MKEEMFLEEEKLLKLAVDAGELVLTSGGEIHRVEDTISRIISTAGENSNPEAIVFPTGIFASMNGKNGHITKVKRITSRSTDLKRLHYVNTLSRRFVAGEFTLGEAIKDIERIKRLPDVKQPIFVIGITMTCLFFSLMFEGSLYDGISAGIVGLFLGLFMFYLSSHNVSYFVSKFLSGALMSVLTIILYKYDICNDYNKVIIGCLMPLVPGVTITNALRDVLNGDFVSGVSRIAEACLVAVAIAGGVGIVLKVLSQI